MARPAFQPTDDQRRQVVELRAARVSGIEIARRVGITKPTLWKYFGAELGAKPGRGRMAAPASAPTKCKEESASELPLFTAPVACTDDVSSANAVRHEQTTARPPFLPPSESDGPFRPSLRQRKDVEFFAMCRMSAEEIAISLDLDVAVLKEHFAAELVSGPVKTKADVLRSVKRASDGGNLGASKLLLTVAFAPVAAEADDKPSAPAAAVPATELGKKIQQMNDAQNAGQNTEWGDDLRPPGLVLVKG